jgi:tRNA dimethylallyltransferase
MTNPDDKLPLALIAGPTASGKTALALELAKHRDVVIINADSAQVYSNLPILSAQPTQAEMASTPHKLFGFLDGTTPCSAADWAKAAKVEIDNAHAGKKLPVLVGGTGLYLRTLLSGIAPVPAIDPDIRSFVRGLATQTAYDRLLKEDMRAATALHANDDTRIKRALEVKLSSGRSIIEWRQSLSGGVSANIALQPLLLLPPRDWLHARCDARFIQMFEAGAIEEVEALLAANLSTQSPVMRAIGVPEIFALLLGEISRNEAIARVQAATRQYAKRQYTWFRNQSPGDWPREAQPLNDSIIQNIVRMFQ